MENKPVISLTEYFAWYTSRLLCNKYCSKVIFASFFYPCHVWQWTARTSKDWLRFFDYCNCRNSLGFCCSKLILIVLKYFLKYLSFPDFDPVFVTCHLLSLSVSLLIIITVTFITVQLHPFFIFLNTSNDYTVTFTNQVMVKQGCYLLFKFHLTSYILNVHLACIKENNNLVDIIYILMS